MCDLERNLEVAKNYFYGEEWRAREFLVLEENALFVRFCED